MFKLNSLSEKNKKYFNKLIEEFKVEGDEESLARYKAIEKLKDEGILNEKKYISFSTFVNEENDNENDLNDDGEIDNEDVRLALLELDNLITTRLEDDLIEFLLVAAEEDIIPEEMRDGIFELVSDHVDLSDIPDEEDDEEVYDEAELAGCDINEVRALALTKKAGGKRRVRCTSGPNKGRIRVAGTCGKKVNLKLSRKLKRVKKRISSSKKKLAAKKALRTAKKRGTR